MNNIIVTESSANIRLLARQAMDGQWKKVTCAVIIFMISIMIPTLILEVLFGSLNPENIEASMYSTDIPAEMYAGSTISSIYTLLVTGAFTFGISLYFLQMIRIRKSEYGHIFAGFGHYFKTFGLYFMVSLFTFLWTLLFIVPGIIAMLRYSQAFYILADDPDKSVMQCIRESKAIMKGNKAKIFCLQLSFVPWMLLVYLLLVVVSSVSVGLSMAFPDAFAVAVIVMVLGMIAFTVVLCVIAAYMFGALTVFYEMVTGRLRPAGESVPSFENQ